MKKRILSIVLCLVMLVGLLPIQAFANDYEDGTECAYCSHYHWGDYMCDECGLCSADCSNSECFTTTHCNECGACLMRNDFCEECRRCENCMESEGGHCTDCGGCFLGESEKLCEECGKCVDCAGEICEECHRCSECAAEDHCSECGIHLYDDPCAGCGKCIDCVEICEDCGYCEECIEDNNLHCEDCGACFEVEGRCTCSDDALHCLSCAGLVCEQCGECEYESGRDFCLDCGLCEECCKDNSHAAGCSTGDVCVESPEWRDHKCENCGEVCRCQGDFCAECGYCSACCKKISQENGCAEGTVCVESADWNTHFCAACSSCFHEAGECGYCGLCAVCCAANAEAEGCDCGDVCVKKDDFAQHLVDYHHGTVSDDHQHKFKTEWSMDATNHWHDCRFCGTEKRDVDRHHWNTEGKCSDCGYEKNAKLRITVQPKDVTHTVPAFGAAGENTKFTVEVEKSAPITTLEYQWHQVRTKKDDPDNKDEDLLEDSSDERVIQGATTNELTIALPNDGCSHKYEYYCVITGKDAEGNTVSTVTSRTALLRTVHNYGALEPDIKDDSGVYVIYFTSGPITEGSNPVTEKTYHLGSRYHNRLCCGENAGVVCGHAMLPAGTRHNFAPKMYLGYGYDKSDTQRNMYYFYGTTCADCGYEDLYWYQQKVDTFYQITIVDTPGAYIVTDDDREITSGYVSSGESLVASAPYVNDENRVFDHWEAQPTNSGDTLPEDFTIRNETFEGALGNAYLKMPACNITLKAVYSDKGPVTKVTIKGAGENPVVVENRVITVHVGTEFSVDTILTPEDAVEKRVIWTVYGTKATGKPELEFTSHQFSSSTTTITKAITGPVTLKANETGTFRLNVRTVESQMLGEWVSDTVFVRIVAADAHVHDYGTTTVPATCTQSGYTLYTCKDAACGRNYKSNFVKATGHNDTNGDGLCDNFNMITKKVCGYKLNKEATMFGRTQIDKVQLTVSHPVRGGTPDNANLKDSTEARYYVATTDWDPVTENNKFGISTKYTVKVELEAADDYGFKLNGLLGVGNTEFFINGKKATVVSGDAQQVVITYEFPATGSGSYNGGTGSGGTTNKPVKSPGTGDPGVMLYAAMGLLSLSGGAWVIGRKRKDK